MGRAMNCPNCDAENPDYAIFCGMCAAELRASSAASGHIARDSGAIKGYDENILTSRNKWLGALNIVIGASAIVSFGYNNDMPDLILGSMTIGLGLVLIFAPKL